LIGNAVLRWEYRPGSTVFIVWQRQQERDEGFGNFDLGRDLDALWGAPAQNRFIIKLHYLALTVAGLRLTAVLPEFLVKRRHPALG
jgi:hypothetical protein